MAQEEKELNQICTMVVNLENYIDKIRNHEGEAEMIDVIKAHNYYSEHQQKILILLELCNLLVCQMKISSYSVRDNLFPYVSENQLSEIIIINSFKRNKI